MVGGWCEEAWEGGFRVNVKGTQWEVGFRVNVKGTQWEVEVRVHWGRQHGDRQKMKMPNKYPTHLY